MYQDHHPGGQAGEGDNDPGDHAGFEFVMFGKVTTEGENAKACTEGEAKQGENEIFGRGHIQPCAKLDRASLSGFRQSFNGPLRGIPHSRIVGCEMRLSADGQIRAGAIANGIKHVPDKLIASDPLDR